VEMARIELASRKQTIATSTCVAWELVNPQPLSSAQEVEGESTLS
jgi:hypothetical protein